jgi:hypothetical protein
MRQRRGADDLPGLEGGESNRGVPMKTSSHLSTVAATIAATITLAGCVSTNNPEFVASHPSFVTVTTSEGAIARPDSTPLDAVDLQWNDAGVVRMAHKGNSGFPNPARAVITDDAEWATAWALLWADRDTGQAPARPAVDFTRNTVILAALGEGSARDLGISLARIASADGSIYAEVATTMSIGCSSPSVPTQPVDVVRIPKAHARVVFVERVADHQC